MTRGQHRGMPIESELHRPQVSERQGEPVLMRKDDKEMTQREEEAKVWFENEFKVQDDAIPAEKRQRFLEKMTARNAKYRKAEDERSPEHSDETYDYWKANMQAMRDRPNMSVAEWKQVIEEMMKGRTPIYGDVNNLVIFFQPSTRDAQIDVATRMIDGMRNMQELPGVHDDYFYWMIKEGILERAVATVGYAATREALEKELAYALRGRRLHEEKGEPWKGYWWPAPYELSKYDLRQEEIDQLTADYYQVKNWYRQLFVALHDQGVNYPRLFGGGEY